MSSPEPALPTTDSVNGCGSDLLSLTCINKLSPSFARERDLTNPTSTSESLSIIPMS